MSSDWTNVAQVKAASESAVADMLLETQHALLRLWCCASCPQCRPTRDANHKGPFCILTHAAPHIRPRNFMSAVIAPAPLHASLSFEHELVSRHSGLV